jgi:membrane fusion protein (multidrug efflux system)
MFVFGRFVFFLVFFSMVVGCKSKQAPPARPDVTVTTVTVEKADIPADFEYVGITQSSHLVEIRARVEGYLDKIDYTEGEMVKEGDLLFEIDPKPFQAALAQAKAQEAQQVAVLWEAERSTARLKPLFEQKAASRRDLDNALAKEDSARASLDAAKAQVLQAELNLGYTIIKSPINGISGSAKFRVGSLVGPSTSQNLLTTVWAVDPIWVNFNVSEGDLLKYHMETSMKQLKMPTDLNFTIEIILSDGTIFPSKGVVDFADPTLQPGTGSMVVRAVIPNSKGILRSGQFVRARLIGAIRPQAIAIPQKAVMQGKGGMYVYIVNKDNTVEMRPVKAGDWYRESWIIEEGLETGERVIVDGTNKVNVGSVVKINNSASKPL